MTDVMTDVYIICTVWSRAEARVTIKEIRSFAFKVSISFFLEQNFFVFQDRTPKFSASY